MSGQLEQIAGQLDEARARAHRVADATPAERWNRRADPERWSVAECLAHLNLTAEAFIPKLRAAFADTTLREISGPRTYRRDLAGWLLSKFVTPIPTRFGRVKTTAAFVPGGDLPRDAVLSAFDRLHAELAQLARDAEGRPLHRMRITSPFSERMTYNAYSALVVIANHAHRHLYQAEHVWGGV